ncbi:hypothetical protein EJB05_17773, partial [Eragrostis curvula]
MQCLARAVAQSARAAAEGYAGRRFVSTASGPAKGYAKRMFARRQAYMKMERLEQVRWERALARAKTTTTSAASGELPAKKSAIRAALDVIEYWRPVLSVVCGWQLGELAASIWVEQYSKKIFTMGHVNRTPMVIESENMDPRHQSNDRQGWQYGRTRTAVTHHHYYFFGSNTNEIKFSPLKSCGQHTAHVHKCK